jgi:copper chaperone CopZ
MERITVDIDGMTCGHCVRAVEGALKDLTGVEIEQVKVGQATLTIDPALASRDRISQAIEDSGYGVTAIK